MINYKIQKNQDQFDILETQTNQIIESHKMQQDAKKRVKHFNFGGGFDGWTPSFFMIDVKYLIK